MLHTTESNIIDKKPKTAVLVAIITQQQSSEIAEDHLGELSFLAETWGVTTIKKFTQKLTGPHGSTFVGTGKLNEISEFIKVHNIGYVIFDDELTLSQVRNLEQMLTCNVLDRSLLILNIFAMRAKTKQAKIQVELAQYQYLLPRLTRMWTHLSRQKGGGGDTGMKGPGEKELETDRRIVQDKVTLLRKRLKEIEKQGITQSKRRDKLVRVALVGYTNVGKSTLMNLLTNESLLMEDKLFATIDATVRKTVIHDIPFLLTDTVGFIRKLPHNLIECFKSTLSEMKEADVLLHVVDISHPTFEEQIQVVNKTLQEIGIADIPTIMVFNKMDKLKEVSQGERMPDIVPVERLQQYYLGKGSHHPVVFIAASKNLHIDALKELLYQKIHAKHMTMYPHFLDKKV